MIELQILRPDDWHVHLRDGEFLKLTVPATAQVFKRAVIMPNLKPPVTTIEEARRYRKQILACAPKGSDFEPLITCYLTDNTDPEVLAAGFSAKVFFAAKLYPAHVTTNSAGGVSDINRISSVLALMEKIGMPLLIHGEVVDAAVDIFDREKVFIDRVLSPLLAKYSKLKIVLEHITTSYAVDFVTLNRDRMAATITAHHLILNRNALFDGGIRPHLFCLPVLKREEHRLALRAAVTSGLNCFFLGTDSAPHSIADKETDCGCAGIFTAPNALGLYAQVFDEENALDKLEGFASKFGPSFYGLPLNTQKIKLEKREKLFPEFFEVSKSIKVKGFSSATWSVQL